MTTDTEHVDTARGVRLPAVLTRAGYFLLHFLEMCVVMCAGGLALLSFVLRQAGPLIGVPNPRVQFPDTSTLLLAVWLTLLMIGWMRLRKHAWQPTLEMASTSVIAFPLLIGAAWLGAVPRSSLFGLECALACAFMLVPMVLRLDHYAGPHSAHMHDPHAEHHHA